ncbi:uromodulin-like [Pyxicephalus adspersus]|uniref:uromodulin-like n=1 Tax=Pyxicephalus adspersus TaxID=30357 RepID=UPI003B5B0136
MRVRTSLAIPLVLLCAFNGLIYTNADRCTLREGTSLTVLMDEFMTSFAYSRYFEHVLNRLSARFPCVTRQYTSVRPAVGTWTLNAWGSGPLNVQILGFTGLGISGNCSNSSCHPNATCGEFGGDQQCTCKKGFGGNGSYCEDINECQESFSNNCLYNSYSCVNTIGSYYCTCVTGYQYKEEFGCVDIDECANSTLNDCHPLAVCSNGLGSYTCTCPYGYNGDGKHCGVTYCSPGTQCNSIEDCINYNGSYSCIDPCSNHIILDDPWRSTSNVHNYYDYSNFYDWVHCDNNLNGWYRLKGEYGQHMPEFCVPKYSCGTHAPMWMNGQHPSVNDGIVKRTACANWNEDCCLWSNTISVKKCSEGYYVYKLQGTPACYLSYCIESNFSCSGMGCAPDEECRIVGGVQGCHCKNSSNIANGIQPGNLADQIKPQVICGLDNIEVTFSKCLLEKLGYDTSHFHLRDNSCQGIINKKDKTYISLISRLTNGDCGGNLSYTENEVTYTNTVYLTPKSDGVIIRNEYPIDFHCTYPSNMEISLLTAIGSFTSSALINVSGTSNFTITMGLFQDSGYSTPYTDSEVWLDSSSMLYVGVIVTGSSKSSPFVLLMKNC